MGKRGALPGLSLKSRRLLANLCVASVAMGASILFSFSPAENSFYPRCPFFAIFHVQCPGCGVTRAVAALLHGHLSEAMHWNAMFVLLLPFLLGFFAVTYDRAIRVGDFAWPKVPNRWLAVSLAIVLAFAIARNVHPF